MHFEILVEDMSGEAAIKILFQKIIGDKHSYTVHAYKGIGRVPKGLKASSDSKKRILLDQLPRLIQGFGRTFSGYPASYNAVLIIICDLDTRSFCNFRHELITCLNQCIGSLSLP